MAWGAPTEVDFNRHGTIWDDERASLPEVMNLIQEVNRAVDKSVPLEDRAKALTIVFDQLLPLLGEKFGKPFMDPCVPLVLRAVAFLLLDDTGNPQTDQAGGSLREVAEKADQLHRKHLPHDCAVFEAGAYAKLHDARRMTLLEKLLHEKKTLNFRPAVQFLEGQWPLLDLRLEYLVRRDAYSNEQLILLVEALLNAIYWSRIRGISAVAIPRRELARLEAMLIQWKLVLTGIVDIDVKAANFEELIDHDTSTVVVAIETLLLMRRVTSCLAQKIEPILKTKAKLLDSLFLPRVVAMILRDASLHEGSNAEFLKVLALGLLNPWLHGRRQIEPIAFDVVALVRGTSFLVPLVREIVRQMQDMGPYTLDDGVLFLVELTWRVLFEAGKCKNPDEQFLAVTSETVFLLLVHLDGVVLQFFRTYRKDIILAAFCSSMSKNMRELCMYTLVDDFKGPMVNFLDLSDQTDKKLKMLLDHIIHPSLVGLNEWQMEEVLNEIIETGKPTLNLAELSLVADNWVSQPDSFSAPLVKKMNPAQENDDEEDSIIPAMKGIPATMASPNSSQCNQGMKRSNSDDDVPKSTRGGKIVKRR